MEIYLVGPDAVDIEDKEDLETTEKDLDDILDKAKYKYKRIYL